VVSMIEARTPVMKKKETEKQIAGFVMAAAVKVYSER
jgi:hypothetical protein